MQSAGRCLVLPLSRWAAARILLVRLCRIRACSTRGGWGRRCCHCSRRSRAKATRRRKTQWCGWVLLLHAARSIGVEREREWEGGSRASDAVRYATADRRSVRFCRSASPAASSARTVRAAATTLVCAKHSVSQRTRHDAPVGSQTVAQLLRLWRSCHSACLPVLSSTACAGDSAESLSALMSICYNCNGTVAPSAPHRRTCAHVRAHTPTRPCTLPEPPLQHRTRALRARARVSVMVPRGSLR